MKPILIALSILVAPITLVGCENEATKACKGNSTTAPPPGAKVGGTACEVCCQSHNSYQYTTGPVCKCK